MNTLRNTISDLTHVLPQNQKLITKNASWSGTIKTDQDLLNAQLKENQQILLMGNITLHNEENNDCSSHDFFNHKPEWKNLKFSYILMLFLTLNTVAVLINHIEDTDETYGYWEPLNYLLNGTYMKHYFNI